MKKLLLIITLFLVPSLAYGQCTGLFPAATLCGNSTASSATPRATTLSPFEGPIAAWTFEATHGIISIDPFGGQATLQIGSPNVVTAPYIDFWAGGSSASARLFGSGLPSILGGGVLNLQGTLSIFTPVAGQKGIQISQTGINTGIPQTSISYNEITIQGDGTNITSGQSAGFAISHFIGSNFAGQHYGFMSAIAQHVATTGLGDRIGGVFFAQASASAGGTNTGAGAKGSMYGANPNAHLQTGATNWEIISAGEADVTVDAGATVKNRFGWMIASGGPTLGAVLDSAIEIGASNGSWNAALLFNTGHGSNALANTASIITSDGVAQTIANVINLPNWTISGNIFNFAPYALSGTGIATHNIGIAANTSSDGIILANTVPATAGNQRYSPSLHLIGQGWKTDATAGSRTTDIIIDNEPLQGASVPYAQFVVKAQTNAAGYNPLLSIYDHRDAVQAIATFGSSHSATTVGLVTTGLGFAGGLVADGSSMYVQTVASTPLKLSTNSAVRMFIFGTGEVQFGDVDQASPAARTAQVQSAAGTSNTAGVNFTFNASRGTGTGAGGNLIWQVAPAGGSGSSQNTFIQAMVIDSLGHIRIGNNTAPALTSCGGGSPAIVGDDTAGEVTMGTTATGCVITFNKAYAAAPLCVLNWQATPLASQSWTVSTTAITTVQTSTSSNKLNYICRARNGG